MAKLPAFQFYPGDWMKDPNLRRCSHHAKGVWMDVLCLAFEGSERGVLVTDGEPWSMDDIACAVGGNQDVTFRGLKELVKKGVLRKRDNDGAFYSERMVRDEEERRKNAEYVKKHRSKGRDIPEKDKCKGDVRKMIDPSSSSSSTSVTPPPPKEDGVPPLRKGWEQWKKLYPIQKSMHKAERLYVAAIKEGATEQELLDGLKNYVESKKGEKNPKLCNPDNWLMDKRWLDEYKNPEDALAAARGTPRTRLRAATVEDLDCILDRLNAPIDKQTNQMILRSLKRVLGLDENHDLFWEELERQVTEEQWQRILKLRESL